MCNELIVDFPERSCRCSYSMRPCGDREGNYLMRHYGDHEGNNYDAVREGCSSPRRHLALSRGCTRSSDDNFDMQSHRHGQPEMSNDETKRGDHNNHRSRTRSCHDSSSRSRIHTSRSRSCDPPLIVGSRSLHFADTSSLYIVTKHHEEREDVSRHDLWYTQTDTDLMKLAVRSDVLEVRDQMAAHGVSIDSLLDEDDHTSEEAINIVCLMGIESRLTHSRALEVKSCRARCVLAVLEEQKRQKMMDLSSSPTSTEPRWDTIALTSFSQTRDAAMRARKLGKRHQQQCQCVLNSLR